MKRIILDKIEVIELCEYLITSVKYTKNKYEQNKQLSIVRKLIDEIII